ncbi:MAG: hypothetical protein KKG59_03725, partial [Nanoarchaeota archaeon]|nr:hypothetical protein [Nanoarchaeota archaeon]
LDFTIRIPECTTPKYYVVKLNVEYLGRSIIYKSGRITVTQGACGLVPGNFNIVDIYNIQDVPVGSAAVYPIKITNTDDYAKSYVVRLVGVDGWGSYYLDSGSVVVLDPGQEKTVNAQVYAGKDADIGERTFMAEVTHKNEVEQIVLVASVKGEDENRNTLLFPSGITILKIVLIILVIAFIVVAVHYTYARRKVVNRNEFLFPQA